MDTADDRCAVLADPPVVLKSLDFLWIISAVRLDAASANGRSTVTRLGQPDGISSSRMAEMLEVDKAGPKVRC
jgi:hypothetical protein